MIRFYNYHLFIRYNENYRREVRNFSNLHSQLHRSNILDNKPKSGII